MINNNIMTLILIQNHILWRENFNILTFLYNIIMDIIMYKYVRLLNLKTTSGFTSYCMVLYHLYVIFHSIFSGKRLKSVAHFFDTCFLMYCDNSNKNPMYMSRGMTFSTMWHFDMCRLGGACAASF